MIDSFLHDKPSQTKKSKIDENKTTGINSVHATNNPCHNHWCLSRWRWWTNNIWLLNYSR